MQPRIALRPTLAADEPFLAELYASTRDHELAPVPWSREEKAIFLRMQFDAQHRHYRAHHPKARFDVVVADGAPIGRLIVDRRPQEIRVVDIALVPEWRGRGVGGRLIRGLMEESDTSGRPVTIHVERSNPARRLYERLGFRTVDEGPVYRMMARPPIATTCLDEGRANRQVTGGSAATNIGPRTTVGRGAGGVGR